VAFGLMLMLILFLIMLIFMHKELGKELENVSPRAALIVVLVAIWLSPFFIFTKSRPGTSDIGLSQAFMEPLAAARVYGRFLTSTYGILCIIATIAISVYLYKKYKKVEMRDPIRERAEEILRKRRGA
jgi:preprotein translocase subunit SecG